MNQPWNRNRVELLENGDAYFPRVFAAIRAASQDIYIETFILSDDKVGRELRHELISASRRGVYVCVTVDGYGSPGLEGEFIDGLSAAGVDFHIFNPGLSLFGFRTNLFRRLHRKLIAIDGRIAFIGGINFIADQLSDFGPRAKQDYAVEIAGPSAEHIRSFAKFAVEHPHGNWQRLYRRQIRSLARSSTASDSESDAAAQVFFVTRDNRFQRTHIENFYRLAFRSAKHELIIANAYFFPGYRLLRDLRQAARRKVRVTLILQGEPDMPIAQWGARLLYGYLLKAGVAIHEYSAKPLHAKVAIADSDWATVGSSNLDPLSLSLNLEANAIIRDAEFNRHLRQRLQHLIENHCRQIEPQQIPEHGWWRTLVSVTAFHILRHFPAWARLLPAHTVTLKKAKMDKCDTGTVSADGLVQESVSAQSGAAKSE